MCVLMLMCLYEKNEEHKGSWVRGRETGRESETETYSTDRRERDRQESEGDRIEIVYEVHRKHKTEQARAL